MLEWLEKTWREFPMEIVQNLFKKCGFRDDQDINIDAALESAVKVEIHGCYRMHKAYSKLFGD